MKLFCKRYPQGHFEDVYLTFMFKLTQNDTCMNHIIYADDTVLLAPSPAALQKLLDIAAQFINGRDLVANMKKTKCMAIKPKFITFM